MKRFLLILTLPLVFFACEQTLEFKPALPLKGNYVIYEEYISSTKLEEVKVESEKEKTGTAFEIHTNVMIEPHDAGTKITWEPVEFLSNGWNQTLLTAVHQKKTPLEIQLDKQGDLVSITGFHKLPEILNKVDQKDIFKRRLLDAMDTVYFKDLWWDRWALSVLLKPGSYTAGQKISVDEVNQKLKTFKADSIVIRGERNPRTHPCIEYAVHYTRHDSFNLELEELFALHKKNLVSNAGNAHISKLQFQYRDFITNSDKYGSVIRPDVVDSLELKGTWRMSVSMSTGLPCYEFKKEEAATALSDSISNKINVKFFRTNENGFKAF